MIRTIHYWFLLAAASRHHARYDGYGFKPWVESLTLL